MTGHITVTHDSNVTLATTITTISGRGKGKSNKKQHGRFGYCVSVRTSFSVNSMGGYKITTTNSLEYPITHSFYPPVDTSRRCWECWRSRCGGERHNGEILGEETSECKEGVTRVC